MTPRRGWMPLIAQAEWRSETRGRQHPVAIRLAGERREVAVDDAWVEASAMAGEPTRRVFLVSDAEGRRYRLSAGSDGSQRVEIEAPPACAP
jgi:hypothetical protein